MKQNVKCSDEITVNYFKCLPIKYLVTWFLFVKCFVVSNFFCEISRPGRGPVRTVVSTADLNVMFTDKVTSFVVLFRVTFDVMADFLKPLYLNVHS